jgi:hypothetical protein
MSNTHNRPEVKAANSERKKAEHASKRAKVLATLSESERKKKQAQYDQNDRSVFNRCGRANALLQLPSYADKGYTWCMKYQAQAKREGVFFFQDSNGVWSARAGSERVSGAGSSAEYARTAGGSDEEMEAAMDLDW